MLEVSNCCGCVNLRTGSFIIAGLNVIAYAGFFIYSVYMFILAIIFINRDFVADTMIIIFDLVMTGLGMLVMFTAFMFNVALLIGIKKYRPRYMRPYIIMNIVIACYCMLNLLLFLVFFRNPLSITFYIVIIVAIAYSVMVVRSYSLYLTKNGPPMASGVLAPQTVQPVADDNLPPEDPRFAGYPNYPASGFQQPIATAQPGSQQPQTRPLSY